MSTLSHTVTTRSAAETRALGARVAAAFEVGDVVLLVGDLGAGKTELAKGIAEGLGIEETVVSPSFTLAREYEGRVPLVHADAYRLEHGHEAFDLGVQERDDAVTVIEWGNVLAAILGLDDALEIRLRITGEQTREITLVPTSPRTWQRRFAALTS